MLEIRDNIHTDIYTQLPSFVREEGPAFAELLSVYYQWLDSRNTRDLSAIDDIDTTFEKYLIFFKEKYLKDFPTKRAENNVDVRFLVKHITDLYRRKGTDESLRLLFRMVFNEEIEIFYPSTSILRASNSIWSGVDYLEMRPVMSYEDYPIRKQDVITGTVSGARAFVDEVIFIRLNGPLIPILYVSNTDGNFSPDDTFNVRRQNEEFLITGKLFSGSISATTVLRRNRVPGQEVGKEVKLISDRDGLGATALVTKVAEDISGRIEFELENSGFGFIYGEWYNPLSPNLDPTNSEYTGFSYDPAIYTPPNNLVNNILISDQVVVLEQTQSVDVRLYDTIEATDVVIEPIDPDTIPLTAPVLTFVAGDVDTGTDIITIESHGLTSGAPLRYEIGSGNTGVTGLNENDIFYLIRVSDNEIKLATSLADALAGVAIDLTDAGSTVFQDINNNGIADSGEPLVTSKLKCIIAYYADTASTTVTINDIVGDPATFDTPSQTFSEVTITTNSPHNLQVGDSVDITNVSPSDFDAFNALVVDVASANVFNIEKTISVLTTYLGDGTVAKTDKFLSRITGSGTIIDTNDEEKLIFFQAGTEFPELPDNGKVKVQFTNIAKDPADNVVIPDIEVTRIAAKNASAQFDVSVSEIEEVTLITDIIDDYVNTTLSSFVDTNDLSFSGSVITSGSTDLSAFTAGSTIEITGSASNDGTFTIAAGGGGQANTITITGTFTNESAGAQILIVSDGGVDYGMSGPGQENINTTLADAFEVVDLKIGEVEQIFVRSNGFDYQNDVKGVVRQNELFNFDKKDLIIEFDIIDFLLNVGDEITQERTIEDLKYDAALTLTSSNLAFSGSTITASTGNLGTFANLITISGSGLNDGQYTVVSNTGTVITVEEAFAEEAEGASVTIATPQLIPYTARAKYIRREENRFYFKQTSFFDFDPTLQIQIFNRTYDVLTLQRDLESNALGGNAFIEGQARFEQGQIEEISITNTGFRYEDNEVVTLYGVKDTNNSNPLALSSLRVNQNGKGAGSWKTKSSFLSESTRAIHDNFYYQEYSYDISSRVPPGSFEKLIKDTVGVAGTKQFSSPLINSSNSTPTDLDVEMQVFDISNADYITDPSTQSPNENGTYIVDPSTVLISTATTAPAGSNLVATILTLDSEITIEE